MHKKITLTIAFFSCSLMAMNNAEKLRLLIDEERPRMPFDNIKKFTALAERVSKTRETLVIDGKTQICSYIEFSCDENKTLWLIERAQSKPTLAWTPDGKAVHTTLTWRGGCLDWNVLHEESPEFLWKALGYLHAWQEQEPQPITTSLLIYLAEVDGLLPKLSKQKNWEKVGYNRWWKGQHALFGAPHTVRQRMHGGLKWHPHSFGKHHHYSKFPNCDTCNCTSILLLPSLAERYCEDNRDNDTKDVYTKEHVRQYFEAKAVKDLFFIKDPVALSEHNCASSLAIVLQDGTQIEMPAAPLKLTKDILGKQLIA